MIIGADDVERELSRVRDTRFIIMDLETRGLDPWHRDSCVVGAAVKCGSGEPVYFPFRHPETENLPLAVLSDLWALVRDRVWANHNLPFDLRMLKVAEGMGGWPVSIFDTRVLAHLWTENLRSYALKRLITQLRGSAAVRTETELLQYAKEHGLDAKADIWRMPATVVAPYAEDDCRHVQYLIDTIVPRMRRTRTDHLISEYMRYWLLLTRMELHGLQIDMPLVDQYLTEAEQMEQFEEREFQRLCGQAVNPRSPKQLKEVLGLESTARVLIEHLPDERVRALLRHRAWSKAARSFYTPYRRFAKEGVLHPSFWFVKTGRLSIKEPALHATPHRSEWFKCKDVFVARPGYRLYLADWSQAEMRLCAHYTQDPLLMRSFLTGADVHEEVARKLGIPRRIAKNINYGAAYGLGAAKLGRTLHIETRDARKWLSLYHSRIKGPRALFRRAADLAELHWYVRLWDGRIRHFDVTSNFPRTASNSILQGGVGAMARRSMLRLEPFIYESLGGRMLLQIHDAILFELPQRTTFHDLREIAHTMGDFPFRVSMPVEFKAGPDWGHMKEVTL